MINYKLIVKVLGILLLIESLFLLISTIVALLYGATDWPALLISSGITVAVGGSVVIIFRKATSNLGKREGYIIVTLTWIVCSFFGALPFVIDGYIACYTDAFFETISGFTTTGASILTGDQIDGLSKGLAFWRSLTQWMGGMGIIVLSLVILPMLGIGGVQLFVAEVPGPTPDKLHPRIKETAKRLWAIYTIFTLIEAVLLWMGDMTFFEAINHALTTMATGGYSTNGGSLGAYSAYSQYVVTIFMIIAGTNFTLSYFAFHLQFKKVWRDEEFRYYLSFLLGFTLVIAIILLTRQQAVEQSFRDALFQVVSIVTTTGYATIDYLEWGNFLVLVLFVGMFFGGSGGSTGGGPKIVRIILMLKNSYLEFNRLVHPKAVIPVRLNHHAVRPEVIRHVYAFMTIYILIFVLGTVLMSFTGLDIESSMGATIACLGNIGPGIGSVGPASNFAHISDLGKWVLGFLMLVGRLEIFTVLVLFSGFFWRR